MGIGVAHRRDHSGAPGLSPRHVPRPRLVALLDDAPGDAIVLAAPAGYGKTTLAAEWARGRTTTWLDAAFAGGDLAAFTGALVSAARRVLPSVRGPEPDAGPEEAAHDVAAALAEWPADAWLVVDDYLLPDGSSAVDTFVDRLLSLAPLRLLVTARTRPS